MSSGNVATGGSNFTVDATDEFAGNRFTSVTVAQGATINSATFSITISSTGGDEPQHRLWAEDVDNAATFEDGSGTFSISGRTRTTASVDWDDTDLGALGTEFWEWGSSSGGGASSGADIKTIIQEIVDRGSWASGNALVLLYAQHTSNSLRDLGAWTYDHDTAEAAKLDIDYTAGGGGGGNPHYYYAQQ